MCFYQDGYAEFADSRVVTARKPHECTACRMAIAPGDAYHRESGKFDGVFFVDKICRRCDYDRLRVVEHELAEGCDWEESWPPIRELVEHLHDSELGQTRPEDVPATFKLGDLPRVPARPAHAIDF